MQGTVDTHPDVEHPDETLNGRYHTVHDKVADIIIDRVGTMQFTYFLLGFMVAWFTGLFHFADGYPFTTLLIIVNCFQLILLPAILRSQNKAAAHHYAKVEADHRTLTRIAKKLDVVANGNGHEQPK